MVFNSKYMSTTKTSTTTKTNKLDAVKYFEHFSALCFIPIKVTISLMIAKMRGLTKISRNKRQKLKLYRILLLSQPKPVAII